MRLNRWLVFWCSQVVASTGAGLSTAGSADLHRWRETFAERLRERGIDAEATRPASRGEYRNRDELWRIKAREQGRLRKERPQKKSGEAPRLSRQESLDA